MPLQDLTPQLRTRLSRVERIVGWFVALAVALLVSGLAYYTYHTAKRKGWFLTKIEYITGVRDASGLKVGESVSLMGFDVGEITRIEANDPWAYYNVTVYFRIQEPYFGYVWSDSRVKVAPSDLLGNRTIEVTKGRDGIPTVNMSTNNTVLGLLNHDYLKRERAALLEELKTPLNPAVNEAELLMELQNRFKRNPDPFFSPRHESAAIWVDPNESPALTDELSGLVAQAKVALPDILALTNRIQRVLDNTSELTANLNQAVQQVRPTLAAFNQITAQLTNGPGAMGDWLIPTNLNRELETTLSQATKTMDDAGNELHVVVTNLVPSFENLSNITSNLNQQVHINTNILAEISRTIVSAHTLMEGLKNHWLLRSAFKDKDPNPDRDAEDSKGDSGRDRRGGIMDRRKF